MLPRKRHLGQDERHSCANNTVLTQTKHLGQQTHHVSRVQIAQKQNREQDHDKPCRFKQKFSRKALPTFAPNSSLICRDTIENTCGRSTIVEEQLDHRETWAAPVRRTESSTKRVHCGLHTARRPESAQLPKRDEIAASRKYCRAALISEMRETRTAQHVCVRKIRTNGQTARLLP